MYVYTTSGADEEIRIWSWNELLAGKFEFKQELHHQQSRGNRGAMMPKSETNDIAIDLNVRVLIIVRDEFNVLCRRKNCLQRRGIIWRMNGILRLDDVCSRLEVYGCWYFDE